MHCRTHCEYERPAWVARVQDSAVFFFCRTQAVFFGPPEGGAQPCCAVECSEGRLWSLGVDVAAALWSSLEVTATPGASFVARLGCLYPVGGLRGTGAGAWGKEQREGRLVVIIFFLPFLHGRPAVGSLFAVPSLARRLVQGTVLPFLASQALAVHLFLLLKVQQR